MSVAKTIEVDVPMKSKLLVVTPRQMSMISPTLMFDSIYRHYRNVFSHMFVGMSPRSFWDKIGPSDPKLLVFG